MLKFDGLDHPSWQSSESVSESGVTVAPMNFIEILLDLRDNMQWKEHEEDWKMDYGKSSVALSLEIQNHRNEHNCRFTSDAVVRNLQLTAKFMKYNGFKSFLNVPDERDGAVWQSILRSARKYGCHFENPFRMVHASKYLKKECPVVKFLSRRCIVSDAIFDQLTGNSTTKFPVPWNDSQRNWNGLNFAELKTIVKENLVGQLILFPSFMVEAMRDVPLSVLGFYVRGISLDCDDCNTRLEDMKLVGHFVRSLSALGTGHNLSGKFERQHVSLCFKLWLFCCFR